MGRPKNQVATRVLSARVPVPLAQWFEEEAVRRGVSVAALLTRLIERAQAPAAARRGPVEGEGGTTAGSATPVPGLDTPANPSRPEPVARSGCVHPKPRQTITGVKVCGECDRRLAPGGERWLLPEEM